MKVFIALTMLAALSLTACKKDKKIENPPVVNEEELITTCQITFTDAGGIQPEVTYTFRDIDGPGGNAPELFDTIRLQANTTYNAVITLLNESVTPSENISDEVLEEADEHLFCFSPTAPLNLAITRTDTDGQFEIGLQSQWVTGIASTGETTIRLKHQPGVKDGTCDPGDTDLELVFRTEIQ